MDQQIGKHAQSRLGDLYESTERSRELFAQASESMPGGSTRLAVYHRPYPIYIDRGEGFSVYDVDGNEYLDFYNNATSLVHGHSHDEINRAAKREIDRGSIRGGPTTTEIDWAEHLCSRLTGVDQVRFTNSGTEATMNAIRVARAATGNDTIAKFEGIYHGTHDDAQISTFPPTRLAGPPSAPKNVPDSAGVPSSKQNEVLTLPFNDPEATTSLLRSHRAELAGIIVAPYMGTQVVQPEEGFLEMIDDFSTEHDVPVIYDEVVSLRGAHGGSHTDFGIHPDLVALGKLIGGGYPVGAFGGREDLMALFDPRGGADIVHAGTFNANPVTAAAGLTALELLDADEVDRLNELGEQLANGCRAVADDHEVRVQVNRYGSIVKFYLTAEPVRDYRDVATDDEAIKHQLFIELLNRGVRPSHDLTLAVSTPMGESEIDEFVTAFDGAIEAVRSEMKITAPQLLR